MITAVDTSVLLDVFLADPTFGPPSQKALRRCLLEGRVVACDVVWAEVGAAFPEAALAQATLAGLGIGFEPVPVVAALAAGRLWKAWRATGGKRDRVVADFLVGAHAQATADRLLTRDRGFYRTWFQGLVVLDPSSVRA